jgi:hypothetical protein
MSGYNLKSLRLSTKAFELHDQAVNLHKVMICFVKLLNAVVEAIERKYRRLRVELFGDPFHGS